MGFLEIIKVILLGIVEGITEWLPVSSTGHMLLLNEFIHLKVREEFFEIFLVVIQLGAIMAVVVLFWSKLWPFYIRPLSSVEKNQLEKESPVKRTLLTFILRFCDQEKWMLWFKILLACLPTIIIALPFDDWIEEHLNNFVVIGIALIVYGIAFIVVENFLQGKKPKIRKLRYLSFKTALLIGLFQVLALIPGTSRSGATIIGGLLLGTSRSVACEFTFFLAIPVMFGASLLKLVKYGLAFTAWEAALLIIGMVVAFAVSMFVIRIFLNYIKRHDFKIFGIYRIALGGIVLVYFLIKTFLF
ncbi:MAG: undecaprenyl-diphosphate phosphatase [Blautia sp.]|nr:undecaprenyl-diphosphate phosphatase [Blautia sp.]